MQLCRNQCGRYIILQEDQGKWKPFDCDDSGNPIDIHDCPNNPYYSQQQGQGFKQKKPSFSSPRVQSSSSTSSGGETLDTKRLLQAVLENTRAINELQRIVDSRTVIDTNKYEQRTNQIYNVIAPLLNKETFKTAAQTASATATAPERQDIIDNSMIHHSQKADANYDAKLKRRTQIKDDLSEIPDSDEYENMKKIHGDVPDDFDDNNEDKNIATED